MKIHNHSGVLSCLAVSTLLIAGCQKSGEPQENASAQAEQQAANAIGTIVETKAGKVSGASADIDGQHVLTFRGIPYAAPPVGELRWKAPQPAPAWTEVRDATQWGNRCPQREGEGLGEISEDCLFLNVTTIAKSTEDKLPVMVFFHGGGLTSGTANSLTYNNNALPRKGVVLVTVNSRLGPIGYMAHPALSSESENKVSGNYGTLDLIASLKWVQDNIAAFGGDPSNVLIFGESGGGTKTLSVLSSPLSKGLFHKAIIESGSALTSPERVTTLQRGEEAGERIAAKLGLDKAQDKLAALRAAKWQDLIAAAGDREVRFPANLIVDGHVLPVSVHDTFKDGKQHDVPLIVGANAGERGELLETVPMLANYASKASSKTYVYNFSHMPAGWKSLPCVAFHGVEIPYVFGYIPEGLTNRTILYLSRGGGCTTNDPGADATDHAVADNVMRMWVNFAKSGNPSVDGLIEWPAYTQADDQYLDIGQTLAVKKDIKSAYVEPPKRADAE